MEKISGKRVCPFDGDLTPQMKMHVGLREAADEAARNQEMKKIYERTLKLMRNGSQNLGAKGPENMHSKAKGSGYHFEPPRMKQMVMNGKLELEPSTRIIIPQDKQTCTNCKEFKVFELNRCFHCIEFFCTFCLSQCSKCCEQFCSKCRFTIYEGEEHVECLNCYR